MYFASTPDLAAAVSGAGGLGMIAAGDHDLQTQPVLY